MCLRICLRRTTSKLRRSHLSLIHTPTILIYFLTLHDALPICQFLTESLVDGERSQSKSFSSCARIGRIFSFSASSPDRKSGSAGMPRPISYAVFCLKKKRSWRRQSPAIRGPELQQLLVRLLFAFPLPFTS